jgi:hypothetical protein
MRQSEGKTMGDNVNTTDEVEIVTEQEAKTFMDIFRKCLKAYKEKDDSVTDEEWLVQLFCNEIEGCSEEEATADAKTVIDTVRTNSENLESLNEAVRSGKSKDKWLADKIQQAAVGISVQEYGYFLKDLDDKMYRLNENIADALSRKKDGHINMCRNLDGNIAEHFIAQTTMLDSLLKGKNVKVDVLQSYTPNSVDVRATNIDTGEYQNYQLKFGKDAKATISYIEKGNYNNQRIIVPTEQLEEVQKHFKDKGSQKTISDHIEAFGVEGRPFTKEDVKSLQLAAQEDGVMPAVDYSHYQTKSLAISIGKNAGVLGLQAAAITTGFHVVASAVKGEELEGEELVHTAFETGKDTAVKVSAAGALQIAVKRGVIRLLPELMRADVIANIASIGVENVKILAKVAKGEISATKGVDQMGRVTVSTAAGAIAAAKTGAAAAAATAWIPGVGPVIAAVAGVVGGTVGYFGGSALGEAVYESAKKVAKTAASVAKSAWNELKRIGNGIRECISDRIRRLLPI